MMHCDGLVIEPGVFTGCVGGNDCPVCLGTGEMKVCPDCLESTLEEDYIMVHCPLCGFTREK